MFGMSAERNEAERPARIDSGGTPPHLLIKYRPRVTNVRYECRAERKRSDRRVLPSAGTHRRHSGGAALCSGQASGNFLINILSPGRLYEADIYVIIYSGQTPVFIKENIQLILYLI